MFGKKINQVEKDFDSLCKSVFNTEDGKQLLAVLKMIYLDVSSIKESTELTYYELGKKEFIQGLINQVHDTREINDIALNMEATYNE